MMKPEMRAWSKGLATRQFSPGESAELCGGRSVLPAPEPIRRRRPRAEQSNRSKQPAKKRKKANLGASG
jgi:hypothetical protein